MGVSAWPCSHPSTVFLLQLWHCSFPWSAADLPLPPQNNVGEPCSKEQSREPRDGRASSAIAPAMGHCSCRALVLSSQSFPKVQAACAASGQGIGLGGVSQSAELCSAHSLRFARLPAMYKPGLWSGDQSQIHCEFHCQCCSCAYITYTLPASNTFMQLLCPPCVQAGCFQAESSRQHWSTCL